MASGLPVVTTRIAGSEELIRDGHSGILVPPDDVAALGQALGKLIADPAWRAELGREARSRMEQEYKWDRVAERYSALITDD
jgi:glycosyltransferase involved in cell wall biosynthesis